LDIVEDVSVPIFHFFPVPGLAAGEISKEAALEAFDGTGHDVKQVPSHVRCQF
jgi:hypothetical protein